MFLRHPAHALSCDPAFFKPLDPLVQVQLPHIEPYDHQVKYHFHCRMAVTVLCMAVTVLCMVVRL